MHNNTQGGGIIDRNTETPQQQKESPIEKTSRQVNVKTGRYYAKPLNDFTIKFTENKRRRLEQDSI